MPKKSKAPETWEEFLTVEWEQWHVHHHDDHPPVCNFKYQVGDAIRYGALNDTRVEELHKDGQLLVISFHDKGQNYGQPFDNHRRLPRIVWWNEVDPVATVEATNFGRPRLETQYIQTGLDSLVGLAYRRGLIDSPEYQRGYVWTAENKHNLIRSIFNRTDIGKFVMLERPYPENRLEIVDGKQRLRCIMDFLEGRLEYEGKTWFQLSLLDKQRFHDVMVQIATLQANRVKKSDILWLFLSINTGGVPQTDEHVALARKMLEEALVEEAK